MLLGSILKRYPQMQGVVYDLPEVVSGAIGKPHLAGSEDRVKIEAGSFFERVPSGCDAYIMKFILHDWSDDHCRQILRLMRQELPQHGRVLICEQVVADGSAPVPAKFIDIEMLALTVGGKERTAAEFGELFSSAGFRLTQVIQTESPVCVTRGAIGLITSSNCLNCFRWFHESAGPGAFDADRSGRAGQQC